MTTRIDKTISKLSGAKDYMGQLAKITGNINSITEEYYIDQIKKVKMSYEMCLIPAYEKIGLKSLVEQLQKEYNDLDLNNLYEDKVKKNKKHPEKVKTKHVVRIRPKDIFESKWFNTLREIEASATNICKQFCIKSAGLSEETQKVINENRDTVEAFKFYNVSVTTGDVCAAVFISREHIGKIIEIILTPMYNVKKYMADHWLEQIDKVVGAKIKEEIGTDETVSREEVQNYIYTFILAKYRLEMTGKPDQFTKILLKSISQFDVAKTSPARLLNIIDSLKLEEIDNNKGIKEMTQLAKAEIQKIAENKEVTPQDILKDIDALLSYGDKEDEEEQKPVSGEKNELFEEN